MGLSGKQRREINCIKYFIPSVLSEAEITEADIDGFLGMSDRGIRPKMTEGIQALIYGKRYREVHLETWKADLRDGILMIWELAEELPDDVFHFIKHSMGIPKPEAFDYWRDRVAIDNQ